MSGKAEQKYLGKKSELFISSPKANPLLRDPSTQLLDINQKKIHSTAYDVKMFNIKKDSLQSNYKKYWNDTDFDKVSQSSYITKTIKDFDSTKNFNYEFPRNEGLRHYGSGFLKKGYCSPSSKLSSLISKEEDDYRSAKKTIQSLEINNSRLTFQKNNLQVKLDLYVSQCSQIENQNMNLHEELESMKMSYQRLMHQYRQLSLIHEDSLQKQADLNKKVSILTDKNFKLQDLLCQDGHRNNVEKEQIQQKQKVELALQKSQQQIDKYVMQLESLRQLISEKQNLEDNLKLKISKIQEQCQQLRDLQNNQRYEKEISKLVKIVQSQKQLQEALQQKIQRLSNERLQCSKCGSQSNLQIDQQKDNIVTQTSIKI